MTAAATPAPAAGPATTAPGPVGVGPIGRLGQWTADHIRVVVLTWVAIAIVFGAFAPKAEKALSGAGWEASGSESTVVRSVVQKEFGGLSSSGLLVVLHSTAKTTADPAYAAAIGRVAAVLKTDSRVGQVVLPRPGVSISQDGHTAIVQAGALADSTAMVAAADNLKGKLGKAGGDGVQVALTGASGMWSDFNVANRKAMLKSELYSWPVTMIILLLAFGSLVAAGLPLMLTILGLVASAGVLFLASKLGHVSIWAMNFAMMFALALGIDYALFIVHRYRGALFGGKRTPREAVAETMDTAGKAVLFSGLTVLISLTAVMIVPSPAFRSMALGIMIAVVFILLATLTLLPAVLMKLGPRIDKLGLPWAHAAEHRSKRFASWAELLWRHPYAFGAAALAILAVLIVPVVGLKTGMPSIKVVPKADSSRVGYGLVQKAFGPGAPGSLQIVAPAAAAAQTEAVARADKGIARLMPTQRNAAGTLALVTAVPAVDPSAPALKTTIDRLRAALPSGALVGGSVAENHDLERALAAKTPIVMGVVLVLGFLLLLLALQAPLIAAVGVLTNLLAVGGAFGIARLIFQGGHGSGLLGFEPQGYLDAWGPVFFFAMIFAISMDYTVFLLSSAREHWERTGNAKEAMVGGLAHSGRVIFAAGGVMVAVFFTFALSGPLPPKEMGVILGFAVLLDALLVRLILIPVALRLLGKQAWALPRWLDRILPDVRFGHS